MTVADLRLPKHQWPIWGLTALVVVGFPMTAFVYFPALLSTGTLPVNGDSISIPMGASVLDALIISPAALALTFFVFDGLPHVRRC